MATRIYKIKKVPVEKIVEKQVVTEKLVPVDKPVIQEIVKEIPVVKEVIARIDDSQLAELAAQFTKLKSILGMAAGGGGGMPQVAIDYLAQIASGTSVTQTVALDATSLAALETISVANFPSTKGATAAAPGTVSVTTTATVIKAAAAARVKLVIRNTSAVTSVFLGYSNAITTANAPIELGPGDVYEEVNFTGIMYGIVSAGSVTVAQQEITT
jgi:hypothetical protein